MNIFFHEKSHPLTSERAKKKKKSSMLSYESTLPNISCFLNGKVRFWSVNVFLRGVPVAYHGKNPVWFVFHCTNNLQSQPIGLRKIFTDYFFFQANQWDRPKSL